MRDDMLNLASTICPPDKADELRRIDAAQPGYYTGMVRIFTIPGGPNGFEDVLIDTRHDGELRAAGLLE